jgi:hypothetical protein
MNGIIYIRNWVRTNGEMSEDGKSITYNCKKLEEVIAEALRSQGIYHKSEPLNMCPKCNEKAGKTYLLSKLPTICQNCDHAWNKA